MAFLNSQESWYECTGIAHVQTSRLGGKYCIKRRDATSVCAFRSSGRSMSVSFTAAPALKPFVFWSFCPSGKLGPQCGWSVNLAPSVHTNLTSDCPVKLFHSPPPCCPAAKAVRVVRSSKRRVFKYKPQVCEKE